MRRFAERSRSLAAAVLLLGGALLGQSADYNRAIELFRNRDYQAASALALQMLEQEPENPAYLHLYGLTLSTLGRLDEAEEQLRRAVSAAPGRTDFRYDLAMILLRRERELEARPLLERVVAEQPHNLMARLYLGRVYHNGNHSRRAKEQFQAIVSADPGFAWVHYHLAKIHLNAGDGAAAIGELEEELRLFPENSLARVEMAEVLIKTGRKARALEHLNKVGPDDANAFRALYLSAKAHHAEGRLERAIEAARQSVRKRPTFPDPHYLLAQLYREAGRLEEARREMAEFQRLKQ